MWETLKKCPRHLLVCEKSSFKSTNSRHSIHVQQHYFNYRVSVLIPECSALPQKIDSIIKDLGSYHLVKDVPLHKLVCEEFITTFLSKGSFYALSYSTRIDQDNAAALLPTGKLIISVDKDTYEELGLEGQSSRYSHKTPMRYVISMDLTASSFAPGGNRYKRVMWALAEKKPLKFDFLMAWNPSDDRRANLISYFSAYQLKEYQPSVAIKTLKDIECPVLQSSDLRATSAESCDAQEFFDWQGVVFNEIESENDSGNFLSTYCCPDPNIVADQATLCTITGFILPEKIHLLLESLCHYFTEPKLTPWAVLAVHGFADSPVTWREDEHGFHKGGENLYSFVVFRNHDYWLQMAVGANDGCPP
ncbi:ribonuclease P protein subunit p40 isoform X1 [Protopterus annectens]|uniref:ribonuclease P protein subunit p40 isoform X1 n=1 Tax=Protopterus annectens TaxID=7888 RepID=UPI001CFB6CA9|nr:ribonuclease P protein subunit p40 isoform X1 [Protopterus annectens]